MVMSKKVVIGSNALVGVEGISLAVPAKIDTGADGTAIWASKIEINQSNKLRFVFFDESSPFYTGEWQVYDDYEVVRVTGSTGSGELRFRVKLQIVLGGKKIRVRCSLTDRSERTYPMLIGKRTLYGKYIVDVTKQDVKTQKASRKKYQEEFEKNPVAFLEKYKDEIINSEI